MSLDDLFKLARAAHRLYSERKAPKSDGRFRLIEAPFPQLKLVQRKLYVELLRQIPVHDALHGRPKTSQLTAAAMHIAQPMVIAMDVRNFFPSVSSKLIAKNLVNAGMLEETVDLVVRLCTRNRRLPQGAPTSPVLARIVVTPLVVRVEQLLAKVSPHCQIAQFFDDLTISGPVGIQRLIPTIHKVFSSIGLEIHEGKTRIMRRGEKQEVLGVWVNHRLEPTAEFVNKLAEARASLPPNDTRRRGLENWMHAIQKTHTTSLRLQIGKTDGDRLRRERARGTRGVLTLDSRPPASPKIFS